MSSEVIQDTKRYKTIKIFLSIWQLKVFKVNNVKRAVPLLGHFCHK